MRRKLDMWANYQRYQCGVAGTRFKKGGIFTKSENAAKDENTMKPRAIIPMADKNYVSLFLVLAVLKRLSVVMKSLLIKGDDDEALSKKVLQACFHEFCSTDYSGYENALDLEMRKVERRIFVDCCRVWGLYDTASLLEEFMQNERPVRSADYDFWIAVRCSGDFWTSMGNCLINLAIVFFCNWCKVGRPDIEPYLREMFRQPIIVEGDDCLLPKHLFHPDVARTLMLKFSAESHGKKVGDCDFLKVTYYPFHHQGRYCGKLGNTLRGVVGCLWVRAWDIKDSKIKALWRMKARSLLESFPGHPILQPLAMRIGHLTRGCSNFKGLGKMASTYWFDARGINVGESFERICKVSTVCPRLRVMLATHDCPEFGRVPIEQQLYFEHCLEDWNGFDMLPLLPSWTEAPDFHNYSRGLVRQQQDDFCGFYDPVVEGLYTLINKLELPAGSRLLKGFKGSCLELKHDWMRGVQIGNASKPGPTRAGFARLKILVVFLAGAASVAGSQVGVLQTMVLTPSLTPVITPLAKADCIRGDGCCGSTLRPSGVPTNFRTASAFSGSLRVTSPSVADAGMQGLPTSRTEGSGHGFQFPKQQKQKGSRQPTKTSQKRPPGSRGQARSEPSQKSVKPMIRQALKSMGTAMGSSLGAYMGAPKQGAQFGKTVGMKISKLIGSGDYAVTDAPAVNSLFPKSSNGGGYAQFSSSSGATRITHREYIKDIQTSLTAGAFSIEGLEINPGLSFNFPYMAAIAQNFEEYRIRGMVFEFVSSCSSYSSGTAMGTTIMAMEYNSAAPAFTNKPQMENSDFAISARFDKNMMYGVECSSNVQNSYYVRSGASSLPVTTTDLGVLYIATQPSASLTAGMTIGELWVSYDIELLRPRITPARWGYSHQSLANAANGYYSPTTTKVIVYGSLTGVTYTWAQPSLTIKFPNASIGDSYNIFLHCITAGTVITTSSTAASGFSILPLLTSGASGVSLSGSQIVTITAYITVSDISSPPYFIITMPSATVAGTGDVIIQNMGNGFNSTTL